MHVHRSIRCTFAVCAPGLGPDRGRTWPAPGGAAAGVQKPLNLRLSAFHAAFVQRPRLAATEHTARPESRLCPPARSHRQAPASQPPRLKVNVAFTLLALSMQGNPCTAPSRLLSWRVAGDTLRSAPMSPPAPLPDPCSPLPAGLKPSTMAMPRRAAALALCLLALAGGAAAAACPAEGELRQQPWPHLPQPPQDAF